MGEGTEKITTPVTDQDIVDIVARDEAGVGALVDAYLPAEEIYLQAAASAAGEPIITTASSTPLIR